MSEIFCSRCGDYKGLFPERHKCPPRWLVSCVSDLSVEELNSDLVGLDDMFGVSKVYAQDKERAAIKYLESDPQWYEYANDGTRVAVIDPSDETENDDGEPVWPVGAFHVFDISVVMVPEFWAKSWDGKSEYY